jgi:hypothetical protein
MCSRAQALTQNQVMTVAQDFREDIEAIARIASVPLILDVICRTDVLHIHNAAHRC